MRNGRVSTFLKGTAIITGRLVKVTVICERGKSYFLRSPCLLDHLSTNGCKDKYEKKRNGGLRVARKAPILPDNGVHALPASPLLFSTVAFLFDSALQEADLVDCIRFREHLKVK